MKPAHYSVEHYADADVAEGFDALRFGGPIGALVADEEARVIVAFVGDVAGAAVLDVGTGTARAALALAARGARVTGVDYSREMLRVGQARVGPSVRRGRPAARRRAPPAVRRSPLRRRPSASGC